MSIKSSNTMTLFHVFQLPVAAATRGPVASHLALLSGTSEKFADVEARPTDRTRPAQ